MGCLGRGEFMVMPMMSFLIDNYLPLTLLVFAGALGGHLLVALVAYLTRRERYWDNRRLDVILLTPQFHWRVIRALGTLAGLAGCLAAYPGARQAFAGLLNLARISGPRTP